MDNFDRQHVLVKKIRETWRIPGLALHQNANFSPRIAFFLIISMCLRDKTSWKNNENAPQNLTRVKIRKIKFRLFSYSQITYQLYSTKDSLNLIISSFFSNSS